MEILAPNGPPELLVLFVSGNGLLGVLATDTRAQQPLEILRVIGNVPCVRCRCPWEGLRLGKLNQVMANPQGIAQRKGSRAPYLGPLVPRRGSPQAGRQKRNKCESA